MGTNPSISPRILIDSGAQDDDNDYEEDSACTSTPASSAQSGSPSTEVHVLDDSCVGSVGVRSPRGAATGRQSDKEKKRGKSQRGAAAAAFEDIGHAIDMRLSSMEDKFATIMEQQLEREERILERRLQAEQELTIKQQEFFLEALKVLKDQ